MNKFYKLLKMYAECWRPHRGQSGIDSLSYFFVPKLDGAFLVRVITIVLVGYIVFGNILIPEFIAGASMEPTYFRVGLNFCWRGKYLFSKPQRGDIVIVRIGRDVSYLKRIIGLPGDTIAFRNGVLYLNGAPCQEPYVKRPCDWNLLPRKVSPGCYYVIGDNRSMPIGKHKFGEVKAKRIIGSPLW